MLNVSEGSHCFFGIALFSKNSSEIKLSLCIQFW